jgi:hypothetical protein
MMVVAEGSRIYVYGNSGNSALSPWRCPPILTGGSHAFEHDRAIYHHK